MGRLTRLLADLRAETLDVCRRALGPRFDDDTDRYEAYLAWREHVCSEPADCEICCRLVTAIRWKPNPRVAAMLKHLVFAMSKGVVGTTGHRRYAELKRDAVLTGLWLAKGDERRQQRIRIGRSSWAGYDADGEIEFRTKNPDAIEPSELGTGTGDFVSWFRAAVINHAEASIEAQLAEWDGLSFDDADADSRNVADNPAARFLERGRGRQVTTRRTAIRSVEPAGGEQAIRKPLSDMEKQILELLKSTPRPSRKAIAARLSTTKGMVKTAVRRIRQKGWGEQA